MSPCQTFYNFNQCSVKLVKTLYPPMCQSSSVTLKHFPLSRHWILLYRTALFIAAIKCQNSWELPKENPPLLVKLIPVCVCETERETAQHFFLCVCMCCGDSRGFAHMAAICEVSLWWNSQQRKFVETGRERERERAHMERGKSEMSCSTSWNVSPVFYWWFDVL